MFKLARAHGSSAPAGTDDHAARHAARPHGLLLAAPHLLAAGIAAAAVGCEFSPTGQAPAVDGGNGAPGDARVVPIDADLDQPDANCAWPFNPRHFAPCSPDRPRAITPLVLAMPGVYTYDTSMDSGQLTGPDNEPLPAPAATQEGDVQAIWVNGFTLASGATLRVEGTRPLMIVSTGDILVRGTIDVSSTWDPEAKVFDTGAGSQPIDCTDNAPQVGGACMEGGGGGGGGGFIGRGGNGGVGAAARMCRDEMGVSGGNGGPSLTSPPARIRGGCAGARGGSGEADTDYGQGGAGGGAVHLVSQTQIQIEGRIHAGGAAGAGAVNKKSGGGGGGSGGLIGLEAPDIAMYEDAILAANGGGGGGGTHNTKQPPGQDGKLSNETARGGMGHGGGTGGMGSGGIAMSGQPGGNGDRGGGGGGGGAGFIVVYRSNPTVTTGAIISPPHTRQ